MLKMIYASLLQEGKDLAGFHPNWTKDIIINTSGGLEMYIDYNNYNEFDEGTKHLKDAFVSPGGVARDFGVTRQAVYYWIMADVINAHRYKGDQGEFIFISLKEYDKLKARKK